jgi:hypothetical protein
VTVESRGLAAVASAAWRLRGNIRATVVVKAEFSFADGILTQVQAQPVELETEMAFVLTHAEVLFAGLAFSPAPPRRIAVWRGSDELMAVDIDALSNVGGTVGGRISPFAPERSIHLRGFSPAALHQPFVELPDTFDSAFFQSAPTAQRLAGLAGGDAVVLDNVYPGHRRLVLRLPTATVSGTGRMDDRTAPIRFGLDTLFIDAKSHRITMLWRGRLAASNREALGRASAIVELDVADGGRVEGDMPPPWPKKVAGPVVMSSHTFGLDGGTAELGATQIRQAIADTPTPFATPPPSERTSEPRAAIPGAPWADVPGGAVSVPSPEGITETVGLEDLTNQGASLPGGLKLPKGIRRPKPVISEPAAVAAPPQVPEAPPMPAPVPAPNAAEQQRELEAAEAMRLEAARKEEEQAAAEERRRAEAERFAAEQRAAEQAAADREARELEERKNVRKKIKTAMYGKFKTKK